MKPVGHEHTLLAKVKVLAHVVQVVKVGQVTQLLTLQATQVDPCNKVPEGHTQVFCALITKVLSAH